MHTLFVAMLSGHENLRMASTVAHPRKSCRRGPPGVMNVDRGDLARQVRRLGQQAKLRRGEPTDRRLALRTSSI